MPLIRRPKSNLILDITTDMTWAYVHFLHGGVIRLSPAGLEALGWYVGQRF